MKFLVLSESSPEMSISQLRAIVSQAPFYYGMIWLNASALIYTYRDIATIWLTLVPFAVLTPLCVVRGIAYYRLRGREFTGDEAYRRLRQMDGFVTWVMLAINIWAIGLAQYGDDFNKMHILCFIILQILSSLFGLLHIPPTAWKAALPFLLTCLYFLAFGTEVMKVVTLVFLVMIAISMSLVFVYYDVFLSRVLQHHQLKQLGDENLRLANTDLLTALPNRRNFFERLAAELRTVRPDAAGLHLGLVDLDGFKQVNDTYGHPAGDAVLCEVGRRLRSFESRCIASRIGGDEFGLIVRGSDREAKALAEEICECLRKPYAIAQGNVHLGATLGLSSGSDAQGNATRLVEIADYALYHGKAVGRNTVVVFDAMHEEAVRRRMRIEQALRDADLKTELFLVFQPIVNVTSGRVVMFEALARWESPVFGSVSPVEFIAVAESCELIHDLTRVLFDKALAAAAGWPNGIALSFNLSAHDLVDADFVPALAEILHASGVSPKRVSFEITETALVRDFAKAHANLEALKRLGVSLALDDFGTGYSSLSYVHRLPIDKLKIDRSFVADLETDRACRDIVRSIIGLCRNLRLDCIAEGVETLEQALLLQSLGCRMMQGYRFGRPLSQADAADRLRQEPVPLKSRFAAGKGHGERILSVPA